MVYQERDKEELSSQFAQLVDTNINGSASLEIEKNTSNLVSGTIQNS